MRQRCKLCLGTCEEVGVASSKRLEYRISRLKLTQARLKLLLLVKQCVETRAQRDPLLLFQLMEQLRQLLLFLG